MTNCSKYSAIRKTVILAVTIAFALFASAAVSFANPYDQFGAGSRANAMGGAYGAISDDIAGVYYNPAALTQVRGLVIEGGYHYSKPNLKFNGKTVDVDKNAGTQFGVLSSTSMIGRGLTVGVNVFIPDDHVMRFMMMPRSQNRYVMYSNDNHVLVADVCGGFEIIPNRFSVGGGLSLMGDNRGGVDLTIKESDPSEGSLDTRIGFIISPIAGLWSRPVDFLRLGLSYREKTEVKLDLPNIINIPALSAFPGTGLTLLAPSQVYLLAQSYSHFSPRMIELGTAFDVHPRVLVSADLTWQEWSKYHNQSIGMIIELTGGLGELFHVSPQAPLKNPRFHDIFVPAVGVEALPYKGDRVTLALRAGYWYRPSPAPEQTGISSFSDSNTHAVSAGFGVSLKDIVGVVPKPLSFDAYFRAHILEDRQMIKNSLADPTGDYTMGGAVLGGGASMTLRF